MYGARLRALRQGALWRAGGPCAWTHFRRAVDEWGDVISKLKSLPQVWGGELFASFFSPVKFFHINVVDHPNVGRRSRQSGKVTENNSEATGREHLSTIVRIRGLSLRGNAAELFFATITHTPKWIGVFINRNLCDMRIVTRSRLRARWVSPTHVSPLLSGLSNRKKW